jgi:hypothetical protein
MSSAASSSKPPEPKKAKSPVQLMASDTLIYLLLVALVWATWQVSKFNLFKASDDTGYWIGVAGAVMMLLLFTYPMRKHFKFAHKLGNIKIWFFFHMILGVMGPLLILLHSAFRIGSLNAGVALYSMVIVAVSGVIGRFLFLRVSRGLHGEKTDLNSLLERAGLDKEDARSRLAFAPEVEARLKAFEHRELQPNDTALANLRRVTWLPIQQYLVYRKCVAELMVLLPQMAQQQNWSAEDLARRKSKAKKLVDQYLNSVVRVAQYSAYSGLFALWHVAHIPFVYLLILTALIHVYAVHVY